MAFEVNILSEHDDRVVVLTDNTTGTQVQVYAFGALLNAFTIKLNDESMNVIDGFADVATARKRISPMFNSAKLSPYVCRVKNAKYSFGEASHHLTKYFAGDNAIHGLVYDAVFSIVETTSDDEHACVKLQHVYDNVHEGYPFRYRIEVDYVLKTGNELSVKSTVTNIDEQLLPITDGWHPYFQLGNVVDECQLEFQSKEILEFDETLIPTGKLQRYEEFGSLKYLGDTHLDNCFTLNFAECQPLCVFRNPAKKVQVEIHPSEAYPYLQIFTPDHRRSIAIENLSAAPDAFNNGIGLKVLEPHESVSFITKYIIRKL